MVTEEQAEHIIKGLSDEDLEERLTRMQVSKAKAMESFEGRTVDRAPNVPSAAPDAPSAAILDQRLNKRCHKCGHDNAELRKTCDACDEPLHKIRVVGR